MCICVVRVYKVESHNFSMDAMKMNSFSLSFFSFFFGFLMTKKRVDVGLFGFVCWFSLLCRSQKYLLKLLLR